jgi:hypothetical protein
MSEFREYLQEYIDTLQTLLKMYNNDDIMVGKAQEIFRSTQDPRYVVLAQKLAQLKEKQSEVKQNDSVPTFKFVDKHLPE